MSESTIPFVKVQGAGNDFVLIDALGENHRRSNLDWSALAPRICNRHFGVGADGILLAEESNLAPAKMTIINADGSNGDMCGNGLRCFTKYLIERRGLTPQDDALAVETGAGVLEVYAYDNDANSVSAGDSVEIVTVDMGKAWLEPDEIPVRHNGRGPVIEHEIEFPQGSIPFTCVSMGNPHAVWFMDEDVDRFPLDDYGPVIETHPDFPKKTNVEIVNVLSRNHIKMRVWERGVGLTMACGTGACAVAVAARLRGLVDESVNVSMPGGDVNILWQGREDPEETVFMTGEASFSYEGELGQVLLTVPDDNEMDD